MVGKLLAGRLVVDDHRLPCLQAGSNMPFQGREIAVLKGCMSYVCMRGCLCAGSEHACGLAVKVGFFGGGEKHPW